MVKEIRKGNQHVYYKAYDEYHAKLYQYVFKYTRSTYLAEETVQLTFIKLWEKRESLSLEYSLSSQLFRMSKSILIDLLRKEKLRQTQELSDIFIAAPVANERVMYKEELENVFAAIKSLPTQSRRVFELSRFDNLSHKEISDRLSISTKTIENHISKALKYLKTNLTILF